MIIVSYDISDDKLRGRFAKMLSKNGAIRLQLSVYEVNNTNRVIDNIIAKIEGVFAKRFTPADSVMIFEVDNNKIIKYGNAIHRDVDVVFL
jgi:CRISPR-associated protein Cas2